MPDDDVEQLEKDSEAEEQEAKDEDGTKQQQAAKEGAAHAKKAGQKRHDAGEAAKKRAKKSRKTDDVCEACENYYKAAQDYERAAALERLLGNNNAAADLDKEAAENYELATEACDECGDRRFEEGDLDAAEEAYDRAIESNGHKIVKKKKITQEMKKKSGVPPDAPK